MQVKILSGIFHIFALSSARGDRKVRAKRTRYINVRFTEDEFIRLESLMHLSGYNNRSKFIRETILPDRFRRRNLSRNDSNLVKQIELLRLDIKRIGVNYNQRVRALNSIAARSNTDAPLTLPYSYIEYDMSTMKNMMERMIYKVNEIAETVAATLFNPDRNGEQTSEASVSNPISRSSYNQ